MVKSKRASKRNAQKASKTSAFLNFDLTNIYPMTENQKKTFDLYNSGKNLFLYGSAGSGKTFISLYLGLNEMLKLGTFQKIIIFRLAVPAREQGFLPGTDKEKMAPYEAPYRTIINELFKRDDAYEIMKQKELVIFDSTSFQRGVTYNNCLLIVDEMENLTFQEMDTLLTRLGEDSKIIFSGDIKQCDLNERKEKSGFHDFLSIIKHLDEDFGFVEFTFDDCVRSGLVRRYLFHKERLNF